MRGKGTKKCWGGLTSNQVKNFKWKNPMFTSLAGQYVCVCKNCFFTSISRQMRLEPGVKNEMTRLNFPRSSHRAAKHNHWCSTAVNLLGGHHAKFGLDAWDFPIFFLPFDKSILAIAQLSTSNVTMDTNGVSRGRRRRNGEPKMMHKFKLQMDFSLFVN